MKKIITACALILTSGGVYAESGPFGNPDLEGAQYPVTMSEPIRNIEMELSDMGLSCDSNLVLYANLLSYVDRDDLGRLRCNGLSPSDDELAPDPNTGGTTAMPHPTSLLQ